jgi:hypothetical protein
LAGQTLNPVAGQAGQAMADETVREIDTSAANIDTSISVPGFTKCLVFLNKRLDLESNEEKTKKKQKKLHW